MDGEDEFLGVNDPLQLAYATNLLRDLLVKRWMERVKCCDPETVRIGPRVDFEVKPILLLMCKSLARLALVIAAVLAGFSILKDSKLESGVSVHPMSLLKVL